MTTGQFATGDTPVACTLEAADLAAQGDRWTQLAARALIERAETSQGLRISCRARCRGGTAEAGGHREPVLPLGPAAGGRAGQCQLPGRAGSGTARLERAIYRTFERSISGANVPCRLVVCCG